MVGMIVGEVQTTLKWFPQVYRSIQPAKRRVRILPPSVFAVHAIVRLSRR